MKRLRSTAVLLTALWAAPWSAGAVSYSGAEPFSSLFLDASARAVGMGGAYTALANDAYALAYNPAGLGRINARQAAFMHNSHFEDITQEHVCFADPGGWGAAVNYLNFGEVSRTTVSNPGGTGLGKAGMTNMAAALGYGRVVGGPLSAGAAVKYVRETIDDVRGSAFALDLGLLYSAERASAGLAVQNLGPTVKFEGSKESLPLNLRAGAAYGFPLLGRNCTAAADVVKEKNGKALFALGFELPLVKTVPVRLGFNTRNQAGSGVSAGLGWKYGKFGFDYALMSYGELGITHRLGLAYTWDK